MPEQLVALSSAHAGDVRLIGERMAIGRGDLNELRLLDEAVSRQHACIVRDDAGQVVLHDLGSRDGTAVNGATVEKHVLSSGDEIQIGNTRFRYEVTVEVGDARPDSVPGEPDQWEREIRSRPTIPRARCDSPLHQQIAANGWRFCPACGREG